jgi:hypothetical protein
MTFHSDELAHCIIWRVGTEGTGKQVPGGGGGLLYSLPLRYIYDPDINNPDYSSLQHVGFMTFCL